MISFVVWRWQISVSFLFSKDASIFTRKQMFLCLICASIGFLIYDTNFISNTPYDARYLNNVINIHQMWNFDWNIVFAVHTVHYHVYNMRPVTKLRLFVCAFVQYSSPYHLHLRARELKTQHFSQFHTTLINKHGAYVHYQDSRETEWIASLFESPNQNAFG